LSDIQNAALSWASVATREQGSGPIHARRTPPSHDPTRLATRGGTARSDTISAMDRAARLTLPPQLLVLGAITSVQFGSAFADKLFDRAGPAGVVLLRLLLSSVVLIACVRPALRGRTRRDWLAVIAFGLVLAGMNWSFYEALDRLPLGPAVTVEFIGPLTVALVGSRRAMDVIWALLAASGVGLLASNAFTGSLRTSGLLLALLAGACWAGYILGSKRVGTTFEGLDGLAIALCIGSIGVLPAGLVEGGHRLLEPAMLGGGLLVALLSSLIPYSLELTALRSLSAKTFGLLMSLEPAAAALAGVIVLGQPLHPRVAVAMLLVVAASIGTSLHARVTVATVEPVG
jgi:inner membrane transporter RhtA